MTRTILKAELMQARLRRWGQPLPPLYPDSLNIYQGAVCKHFLGARDHHDDSRVNEAYAHLMNELEYQFNYMIAGGVRVTFHDDDPTPINPKTGKISHKLFVEAARRTGELRVFRSAGDHPILDRRAILHNGRFETMNSIFRAVHDWLGHLASGGGFGWKGETTAFYSHAQTFSLMARAALFNETVAHQCYYAIHKDFAPQKCVYFAPTWHNPPLA